jgi:hypothetical protein
VSSADTSAGARVGMALSGLGMLPYLAAGRKIASP